MADDPWSVIAAPAAVSSFNARRVDAELPWDFYWARSFDNKCVLTLRHGAEASPKGVLPRLKGIDVNDHPSESEDTFILALKLRDTSQTDIFLRLCNDIVNSTHGAASEREAVAAALGRTWRWHHLLRGGRDERLSPQQQKGLIGELLVLQRFLLPQLMVQDAINAWSGPLGSPKDFVLVRLGIEVKARRGTARPFIVISSEFQLDDAGTDHLFLYVVELSESPAGSESAFTLTQLAADVLAAVVSGDQRSADQFQALLAASGFRWEDDYSDSAWVEGAHRVQRVESGFPRITASVPTGVEDVSYSIGLRECVPFEVADAVLKSAIRREAYGERA